VVKLFIYVFHICLFYLNVIEIYAKHLFFLGSTIITENNLLFFVNKKYFITLRYKKKTIHAENTSKLATCFSTCMETRIGGQHCIITITIFRQDPSLENLARATSSRKRDNLEN
jgi:hypothetical protein